MKACPRCQHKHREPGLCGTDVGPEIRSGYPIYCACSHPLVDQMKKLLRKIVDEETCMCGGNPDHCAIEEAREFLKGF